MLHKKSKEDEEHLILDNLTRSPKQISSIYFYDGNGSDLFEKITQLEEYYLTHTEIPLIKKASESLRLSMEDADIVEFGSGDCTKISLLLEALPSHAINTICYIPFDVSKDAIEKSANNLLNTYPEISIKGIVADFMTQLNEIQTRSPTLYCFLGSTIGNLSMQQAKRFLSQISSIMNPDDTLLVGFDMVKDKTILERAYNDSQQVTEAFNKNILSVINSRIGTDFNLDDFNHLAFYNDKKHRIEMHLQAKKQILVHCQSHPEPIHIQKNERILTEHSYKFTDDHIQDLASHAGLDIHKVFTDDHHWFSLVQFKKKIEDVFTHV